ncbi:hypothetical protein ACLOJK_036910 [Asimina triloba]
MADQIRLEPKPGKKLTAKATWGPFVLINIDGDKPLQRNVDDRIVQNEWLGSSWEPLATGEIDTSLRHVRRREYTIECNWKVFCDNYLDGGYHVPYAHGCLASGLKLDSYTTSIFEKVSIQKCNGASAEREDHFDRLGKEALYAFVYPNFMINRGLVIQYLQASLKNGNDPI